ncbi:phage virion morphogenesis protein [Nevskia sp.]|uniref:phage virion morphogenesis protein n=1 Tax=Nevskia sp. TaxID=1929292 RepID=UPI0025ED9401|nr:phage virion morphogenesis protein [Nevskia sp.]
MAGAIIELDLRQLADLSAAIARYEQLVAAPEPLLDTIGQLLANSTEKRFDERTAPDGTPWAPVSEDYARRKQAGRATKRSAVVSDPGQVLELTLDLRRLVRHQVVGDELLVGSDRPYAATHQFGRGGIPARPFLGVSPEDEREIGQIVRHYLQL